MNSLHLLVECHRRGYLSKEAADSVAEVRERLIMGALKKEAKEFVEALSSREFDKEASSIGSSIGSKIVSKYRSAKSGIEGLATSDGLWERSVRNLALLTGMGAAVGAGGAGVDAFLSHRKDTQTRKRIERSYPQMFKLEPDLNEHDKSTISRNFQVLATYAPSIAANPVVAATWSLEKAIRGRIEPLEIKSLAETQTAIDRASEREHFIATPAARNIMGIATSSLGKIEPLKDAI